MPAIGRPHPDRGCRCAPGDTQFGHPRGDVVIHGQGVVLGEVERMQARIGGNLMGVAWQADHARLGSEEVEDAAERVHPGSMPQTGGFASLKHSIESLRVPSQSEELAL